MSRRFRIAVVGDAILDTYWFGSADRLSPEAPVPVVDFARSTEHLGGAANVAHNLATLGAEVTLFGVVGDDDAGRSLISLLQKEKIGYTGVLADTGRPTTHKLRIVAGQHQVVRVDRELRTAISEQHQGRLMDRFKVAAPYDAVIISDYGKGVITDTAVSQLRAHTPLLVVDPVPAHGRWYAGADYATPNRKEARELADNFALPAWQHDVAGARALTQAMGMHSGMLLTLGAEGLLWADATEQYQARAQARAVYDVTGAGDTVIAAFVYAQLSGLTIPQAMHAANAAAGTVVAQLGIATVPGSEFSTMLEAAKAAV